MKKLTKRLMSTLLACGMVATLLAGCGSKNPNGGAASSGNQPQHINTALAYMEPGLDPSNGTYGWVTVRMGVTETLVKLNDEVKIDMWLAESINNTDQTTWEVVIRDGISFSNGTPVNAQAVKTCFERTLKNSERAVDLSKISSMEADGQKLTIKTSQPNAALRNNLAEPVFSIYDATQSDESINTSVIGTGPFVVSSFVPEQSAQLKKNVNYWDGNVGLDTVSLTYISDAEARTMALQSGELDVATNIDNATKELFSDTSKYTISTADSLRVYTARMNVKEVSPLSDVELRRAIAHAVDRASYANLIGGSAAHSGFSDAAPFGNDKINAISYDKNKAMQMLDAAGYVDANGDGIRDKKDGSAMKLVFMQKGSFGSNDASVIATAIQSDLKAVGIQMEIQTMESSGHSEPDSYYDFYTIQENSATTGDPQAYLSSRYGSATATGYSSPKIDAIVEQLNTTFDTEERYKLAAQASQILNDEAADLFLTNGYLNTVSAAKVKNAKQPVCDYYFLTKDIVVQ